MYVFAYEHVVRSLLSQCPLANLLICLWRDKFYQLFNSEIERNLKMTYRVTRFADFSILLMQENQGKMKCSYSFHINLSSDNNNDSNDFIFHE